VPDASALTDLVSALSVAQHLPSDSSGTVLATALADLESCFAKASDALDEFDQANVHLARARLLGLLGHEVGDCLRQALRLARMLGPEREDQRLVVHVLLDAATEARGRGAFGEARSLLEEAVERADIALGAADPDTAEAYNCLGLWARYRGEFDLARASYRTALAVLERLPEPGARATVWHNLASLEQLAGDAGLALELIDVALGLRPADAVERDADKGVKAVILGDLGRHAAAEALYRSLAERLGDREGAGGLEMMHLNANWAVLEQRRGDLAAARDRYARAIEVAERRKSPEAALIYANAAHLAFTCGEERTAGDYARRAVAGLQDWASDDLPSLVLARQVLDALAG
jgi:tetratricopeptide (TPR) repeat protein